MKLWFPNKKQTEVLNLFVLLLSGTSATISIYVQLDRWKKERERVERESAERKKTNLKLT